LHIYAGYTSQYFKVVPWDGSKNVLQKIRVFYCGFRLGHFSVYQATFLDLFLWGFVKDQVFVSPLSANVFELRTRIIATVAEVTPEMLRSVWQEIGYRWDVCRIISGSLIEPQLSQIELGVFWYIMAVQNTVYVL
jgi:hypothetical protein